MKGGHSTYPLFVALLLAVFSCASVATSSAQVALTFAPEERTVPPGAQVCLPVVVRGFDGILKLELEVNYDPAVLRFESIRNSAIPTLDQTSHTPPAAADGTINIDWLAPGYTKRIGEDLPDGAALLELCFTAKGAAGDYSDVRFTNTYRFGNNNPNPIIFDENSSGRPIEFLTNRAVVGISVLPVEFEFGTAHAADGELACIPVYAQENFANVRAIDARIQFNTGLLNFIGASNLNSKLGTFLAGKINLLFVFDNIIIVKDSLTSGPGVSVDPGEKLFDLCFEMDYPCIDRPTHPDPQEPNLFIGFVEQVSTIRRGAAMPLQKIRNKTFGSIDLERCNPDLLISGGKEYGAVGDIVSIGHVVSGFHEIARFEVDFNFDPSLIQALGVKIPAGAPSNFTTANFDLSQAASGLVRLRYSSPTPQSVRDVSELFAIDFKLIGPVNSVAYIVPNTSGATIRGAGGESLALFVEQRKDPEYGVAVILNSTPVETIIGTAEGLKGSTVCVDITVDNFTELAKYRQGFSWDASILKLVGEPVIHLPIVSNGPCQTIVRKNFGEIDERGYIGIDWFAFGADPPKCFFSLPKGAKVVTLCFQIIGDSAACSPIVASEYPGYPEYFNYSTFIGNGSVVPIPYGGYVTEGVVCTDYANGFTLRLPEKAQITVDPTCVTVEVEDYNRIEEWGVSLGFDTSMFNLVDVKPAPSLKALTRDDAELAAGRFGLAMSHLGPTTLPTPSNAFELCFVAKPGPTGCSPLVVAPGPKRAYVFANGRERNLAVNLGSLCRTSPYEPIVVSAVTAAASCDGRSDGAITLTVSGGGGAPVYAWTGPGTVSGVRDQTGLAPGTYNVRVSDPTGWSSPVQKTYVLSATSAAPVARAGADIDAPCGITGAVRLEGSASSVPSGTAIVWRGITGSVTLAGGGTSLNPSVNGQGAVELKLTSVGGCVSLDTVVVKRMPSNTIDVVAGGDLSCSSTSVTLEASVAPASGATLKWSTVNGVLPTGPLNTRSLTVANPGTYTLTAVNDASGCASSRDFVVGDGRPVFVSTVITPDSLSCLNTTVALRASVSTPSTPLNYAWSTSDGSLVGATDQPYATAGEVGTYTLTVYDPASGCSHLRLVRVGSSKAVPVVFAGEDVSIDCASPVRVLSADNPGARKYRFLWTGPAGGLSTDSTRPQVSVTRGGTYRLKITDVDNGCTAEDVVEVSEDFSLPTVTVGGDRSLGCDTPSVRITGTASGTGTELLVRWTTTGGGIRGSGDSLSVVVDRAGTYVFTAVDPASGCRASDSLSVTQTSTVPMASAGPGKRLDCATEAVTLEGSGSGGAGFSVSWTTADGMLEVGSESRFRAIALRPGTYTLTVTNRSTGCRSSSSTTVTSDKSRPRVTLPVSLVGNCDRSAVTLAAGGEAASDPEKYIFTWTGPGGEMLPSGASSSTLLEGSHQLVVRRSTSSCDTTLFVEVAFAKRLPAFFSVDTSALICGSAEIKLQISEASLATGQAVSWLRDGAPTSLVVPRPGGAAGAYVTDAGGNYQLVLTDTVGDCVTTSAATEIADLRTTLTVDAGPDLQFTCRDTVLTALAPRAADTTWRYAWTSPGFSPIEFSNSREARFRVPNTYTLTVTDPASKCKGSDEIIVRAVDATSLSADLPPDYTLGCGEVDTLNVQYKVGSGPATFRWWVREAASVTLSATGSLAIDRAGVYYVQVTDEATGCETRDSISVDQVTKFTLDSLPAYDLTCVDTAVTVTVPVDNPSNLRIAYDWRPVDGGRVIGAADAAEAQLTAGVYEFTAREREGSCVETRTVTVRAHEGPRAEAFADVDYDACTGELMLSGNESDTTRGEWRLLQGSLIGFDPALARQSFSKPAAGNYRLSYRVKPEVCAISAPATVEFTIEREARVSVYDRVEEAGASVVDTTIQIVPSAQLNVVARVLSADSAAVSVNAANRFGIRGWTARTLTINYEVCDRNCLTRCDTAEYVLIRGKATVGTKLPERGFPNTITPNGDGRNDLFVIEPLFENPELYPRARLTIVNRWGTVLFSAQPYTNNFGGLTDKGSVIPNGTYYYVFMLDPLDGEVYKGHLTIIK